MLVLRRKTDESLQIGENITVSILAIEKTGQVKIGITAPHDIPIVRSELLSSVPPRTSLQISRTRKEHNV